MNRLVPLLVVLAAPVAFACGNAMEEEGPALFGAPGERALLAANAEFSNRDYASALEDAEEAIEEGKHDSSYARGGRTVARARLIAGQAALRLSQFEKAEEHLRGAAHGQLPAQPYDRARLAEALVGQGKFVEASVILEALAARDLMPDGLAWRALARIRAANGNRVGADEAEREAIVRGGDATEALPDDPLPRPAARWPLYGLAVSFAALGGALAKKKGWIRQSPPVEEREEA